MKKRLTIPLLLAALSAAAPGCASDKAAVSSGRSTALDGDNLLQITDDMARQIVADDRVQAAIRREGKLSVVVQPVENGMTAEILPQGPADAFTSRIRTLLAKAAPNDFVWILNRDAYLRLRLTELDPSAGPAPINNPRYVLNARFTSATDENRRQRKSFYVCTYQLVDLQERTVLWTAAYNVEKKIMKGGMFD